MNEPHLLLIGGGHAHVAVLADWIKRGRPARTTLITPSPTLRYSGMVPGWLSGEHDRDAGLVDLAGLAERAGVDLVLDRCVGISGANQTIATASSGSMSFDVASLDTGGVGRAHAILGEDARIIDVRPIDGFVEKIAKWRDEQAIDSPRIAVVGGGAGGVELAFGLRNLSRVEGKPDVTLVAGALGLLPEFSSAVTNRVRRELRDQQIELIEADASMNDGKLHAGRLLEPVDLIVAALGSAAPVRSDAVDLAADAHGFIEVDPYQRSTSHPNVFAVGDVAARQDRDVPRSGVHAVHAGKILAANLRSALTGGQPSRSYVPRPTSLYLLSTGNGSAIGSYGPLAFQGRWVAKLKRRIDKGWIASYARLALGQ